MPCTQSAWQSNAYHRPRGPGSYFPATLAVLAVLLSGCGVWPRKADEKPAPPEPAAAAAPVEPEPEAPPAERPELTRAELAEIRYLLDEADRAIRNDHLTYPAKGSALDLYEEVQILDPDNEDALRGLERIVERYLDLAMEAAEGRRFDQAGTMLDRARLVDPQHPGIDPVRARVDLLRTAERRVIELDGEQLRNQDAAMDDTLRQAGMASRADGCRAEIIARNDSEGRWIYQRMSEAAGRSRIQAQLEIGSPPRIEVLCFSTGP